MIRSMTGYGRAQSVENGYDVLVEIKSVNHRYFEFSARVPRNYAYLEEKLKSLLSGGYASRGKIDVYVNIYPVTAANMKVSVNEQLAGEYVRALRGLKSKIKLKDNLSLSDMARLPDVFTVTRDAEDAEFIWETVKPVAERAFSNFVEMRKIEGEKMKKDIISRVLSIEDTVSKIEKQSPITAEKYKEKLYSRIKEVLGDKNIDEQRILTEVAIFAEKIAVDEETVRLKSHLRQIKDMLESSGEPIGRKLDFIVQEANREINTTGSKAQDIEIARMVVDVKAEIEKIREQIQNIE